MEPLTDEEIRTTLASYGDRSNIPITPSTRRLLLNKIAKLKRERAGGACADSGSASSSPALVHVRDSVAVTARGFAGKLNPVNKDAGQSSVERANSFPSLKIPDLNDFRTLVEKDDAEEFEKSVWSNPLYLITPGDTPQILKKGPWYNALHCACARTGSLGVCKKLFQIIEGDR